VFGESVSARQAEATAAATFFASLKAAAAGDVSVPVGGFPVIIAGDSNDWASWRDTVSDHLGVMAEVTVQ